MINQVRYSYLVLGLGLGLASASAQSSGQDTLRLSLQETLELGAKRNLSVRGAEVGVQQARYDQRVGRARLFPTVELSGQYGYALKKQKVYFGDSGGPMSSFMPSDGIEMGETHNLTGGINATLPLIAPQLWASLAVDRLSVETALEKVRSSSITLRQELRRAYLGILLANESHRVLSESLQNLERNKQDIALKYQQGLVAEYDLIRMESQVKNLVPSVLEARQQIRLAQMKLLVLLDLAPETPLALTETLEHYRQAVYSQMPETSPTINLTENSTLRSLELGLKQLELGIKVKRREYLPTLGLSFNYTYNYANDRLQLSNSKRWSPSSNIGLGLTIPLFSGGSTRYGIKSLESQLEQLRLERQHAEQQLRLQASSYQTAQRNAAEQFVASQEAERSATKGLQVAQVRYRSGAGTLLELNDAELAQRQAQLNLNQAIYNYMIALYDLEALEGR